MYKTVIVVHSPNFVCRDSPLMGAEYDKMKSLIYAFALVSTLHWACVLIALRYFPDIWREHTRLLYKKKNLQVLGHL